MGREHPKGRCIMSAVVMEEDGVRGLTHDSDEARTMHDHREVLKHWKITRGPDVDDQRDDQAWKGK